MQTAVLDSTVDQIRSVIPEANPAAAIASKFLGKEPSDQVWFLDRMHHYRKFHDEYLARQEALLFRHKEAGEVSALRQARRLSLLHHPRSQTISQSTQPRRLESAAYAPYIFVPDSNPSAHELAVRQGLSTE